MSGDTAIQRLNEVICKDYTVSIICDRSKMLDSYEEGEKEQVYWTSGFYHRSFDTNPDNLSSCLKEAIENFLIHYTQYDTFEDCMRENFDESYCDFIVYRHVNKDCNNPSEDEIELWKAKELDLYAQYTDIKVSINSRFIDLKLIIDLIKGE